MDGSDSSEMTERCQRPSVSSLTNNQFEDFHDPQRTFRFKNTSQKLSASARIPDVPLQIVEFIGVAAQIAPPADSDESKSKRGGKRPGAGKKPNLAKVLLKCVSRTTILAAVANDDVGAIITGLLKSKREQTRIEALHFIFDRVMGKPKQDVNVSGGLLHAHMRDPLLAALPKEALEEMARAYDVILAKHALPVLDVAQDAPQNQIESKPAIEGRAVTPS